MVKKHTNCQKTAEIRFRTSENLYHAQPVEDEFKYSVLVRGTHDRVTEIVSSDYISRYRPV